MPALSFIYPLFILILTDARTFIYLSSVYPASCLSFSVFSFVNPSFSFVNPSISKPDQYILKIPITLETAHHTIDEQSGN